MYYSSSCCTHRLHNHNPSRVVSSSFNVCVCECICSKCFGTDRSVGSELILGQSTAISYLCPAYSRTANVEDRCWLRLELKQLQIDAPNEVSGGRQALTADDDQSAVARLKALRRLMAAALRTAAF